MTYSDFVFMIDSTPRGSKEVRSPTNSKSKKAPPPVPPRSIPRSQNKLSSSVDGPLSLSVAASFVETKSQSGRPSKTKLTSSSSAYALLPANTTLNTSATLISNLMTSNNSSKKPAPSTFQIRFIYII